MTNDSHGEAYGTKALNLTVIGVTMLIMMGVLWQPAAQTVTANKPAAQVEQVVAKAPAARPIAG